VRGVLQEKIAEHAKDLLLGTLEESSLLALVVGGSHLDPQNQAAVTESEGNIGVTGDRETSDLEELKNMLSLNLEKFRSIKRTRPPKKGKLLKRDVVIFAAILLGIKGPKYCSFLHERQVKPKWLDSDSTVDSYPKSYMAGGSWRKKVQDEKTRAESRMGRYTDSELSIAFQLYAPNSLAALRERLLIRAYPSISLL